MKPIVLDDIQPIPDFVEKRADRLGKIIALKKPRRLSVGPNLTFVFENRDTIRFQIQEMVRVERLEDPAKVKEEVDVYNTLMPGLGELSATLFIEVVSQERVKPVLDSLIGLEASGVVAIKIGVQEAPGRFEEGRSEEDRISAVHYVKFPFSPEAAAAFRDPTQEAFLEVRHPNYTHRQWIPDETRRSLIRDLGES